MRFFICLALCAVVLFPNAGCSGCQKEDPKAKQAKKDAEKKKKAAKKKKPKPDIEELARLRVQPHAAFRAPRDDKDRAKLDKQLVFAKPGHWTNVSHYVRANNRDFQGQLIWQAQHRNLRAKSLRPLPLKYAFYYMNASRPVVLSKKQKVEKRIDMTLFMPRHGAESILQYRYQGHGGRASSMPIRRVRHMPSHQYFFVVLSSQPEIYQSLRSERTMWTFNRESGENAHYRFVGIKPDRRTPLPTNSLTWTSIAYILWDDVDPSLLTPEQQQAMLDWLHWGGQLIVSGPDSLELLRGSFLERYLPVRGGKALEIPDEHLAELRRTWRPHLNGNGSGTKGTVSFHDLAALKPWSGIELILPEETDEEESAHSAVNVLLQTTELKPLLVEQRVGRGRIAVSAFRLRQRELRQSWSGFDNFLNSHLLRRRARDFAPGNVEESALYDPNEDVMEWAHLEGRRDDPRLVTSYRLFSRDAGYKYKKPQEELEDVYDPYGANLENADLAVEPGIGGWSDVNAVANSARETIRIAAGIDIPEPTFVIQILFGYLIVLVPLNWGLFRLIGRVEWAWIAAPFISIGGALLVIQLAQLDIGFVRSRTELAVVELQPDYPRAHVTRYTALYTSLSTQYDLEFTDSDAVVQPFPMQTNTKPYEHRSPDSVHYRSADRVGLTGFHVISNSTGVLHSEQMVDLGGTISLSHDAGGRIRVTNGTTLSLAGVAVVRRRSAQDLSVSRFRVAMLGSLAAGETTDGTLQPVQAANWHDDWTAQVKREEIEGAGTEVAWQWLLNPQPALRGVLQARKKMLNFDDLGPGDTRLVAITAAGEIPGLNVHPAASQSRHATLVVANLKFNPGAAPDSDNKLPRNAKWANAPFDNYLDRFDAPPGTLNTDGF